MQIERLRRRIRLSFKILLTDRSMRRDILIFGADMSSSVLIDNKNRDVLILGDEQTQGIDDTTLLVEAICRINFTQPNKIFVLSLNYNGSNSFTFVNAKKYLNSKQKSLK